MLCTHRSKKSDLDRVNRYYFSLFRYLLVYKMAYFNLYMAHSRKKSGLFRMLDPGGSIVLISLCLRYSRERETVLANSDFLNIEL